MDMKEFLNGLSPELREKASKCSSAEEILALAKKENVALPDDVLAEVAGGQQQNNFCDNVCPKCGAKLVGTSPNYTCSNPNCGYTQDGSPVEDYAPSPGGV